MQLTALPLSQANVRVINTEMGSTTDEQGEFLINIQRSGYYSLLITYMGYDTKVLNDIWVRPNADDFQQVTLFPAVFRNFDNVTVTQNYFENSGPK